MFSVGFIQIFLLPAIITFIFHYHKTHKHVTICSFFFLRQKQINASHNHHPRQLVANSSQHPTNSFPIKITQIILISVRVSVFFFSFIHPTLPWPQPRLTRLFTQSNNRQLFSWLTHRLFLEIHPRKPRNHPIRRPRVILALFFFSYFQTDSTIRCRSVTPRPRRHFEKNVRSASRQDYD